MRGSLPGGRRRRAPAGQRGAGAGRQRVSRLGAGGAPGVAGAGRITVSAEIEGDLALLGTEVDVQLIGAEPAGPRRLCSSAGLAFV